MDKGLTVKWVLIVWQEMPQMPQNVSAQFVCPSPKVLHFNEKRLHWASIESGVQIRSYIIWKSTSTQKETVNKHYFVDKLKNQRGLLNKTD